MSFEVDPDFQTLECELYCSRVADGTHDSPKETSDGKLLVTSKNVKDGRLSLDSAYRISQEDFDSINKRSKVDQWDLLLTMIGTVGEVCLVTSEKPEFAIKNVGLLKCGDELKAKWLYYFFRSPQGQHLIEQRKKGSTQQYISLTEIRRLPVSFPSNSSEMSEIVHALTCLDDRITLLRETNATLEAIAQALFKSWFVDFDPVRAKVEGRAPDGMDEATAALFPDSFEETGLGMVPKGWRVATLHDCCKKIESGGTPKRNTPEFWNGSISWLTSGEVRNPIVFGTKEKITESGVSGSSAKLWPAGTTVVAMYGATAGEVCLIASPMTANQACCGLIPQDDFRAFLFFCSRREREDLASKSSGSAQQNLNKGLVEQHQVIRPTNGVVAAFEMTIGTMLDRWIECELQAQTLSSLRDTLLPRLISGQLKLDIAKESGVEQHA